MVELGFAPGRLAQKLKLWLNNTIFIIITIIGCISQGSPEKQPTGHIYVYLKLGIGSCSYGDWHIQDLQGELTSWRPRRANGVVLVWQAQANVSAWVQGQENVSLQILSGRKEFSYLGEDQPFCSIQALNWLDETHSTSGRTVSFTQLHI